MCCWSAGPAPASPQCSGPSSSGWRRSSGSGLVKLWVVDPKGGMELAAGRPLFDRFAYGDAATSLGYETALAVLLEDAVAEMRAARRLAAHPLHTRPRLSR